MDDVFDWDWLVLMGFTQLEGAAEGVLALKKSSTGDLLICVPEFVNHELGEASWMYRDGTRSAARHDHFPRFLAPKTKEDIFWLLKKLGFEK